MALRWAVLGACGCIFLFVVVSGFTSPRIKTVEKQQPQQRNLFSNPFASPEPTGSALIDAVLTRQAASVKAVLARGGKEAANERDAATGNTAMHFIARQGHYKFPPEDAASIPRLLIDAGLDINSRNKEGKTPLEISLLSGWQRIAYLLLEKGADRSVVTESVKSKITCPDCKRVVKEYNL
jgi:ankyrin repeat protein